MAAEASTQGRLRPWSDVAGAGGLGECMALPSMASAARAGGGSCEQHTRQHAHYNILHALPSSCSTGQFAAITLGTHPSTRSDAWVWQEDH